MAGPGNASLPDWATDKETAPTNRPPNWPRNRAAYEKLALEVAGVLEQYPTTEPPAGVHPRPPCEYHKPMIANGVMFCLVCGAVAEQEGAR